MGVKEDIQSMDGVPLKFLQLKDSTKLAACNQCGSIVKVADIEAGTKKVKWSNSGMRSHLLSNIHSTNPDVLMKQVFGDDDESSKK